jgi:hypothetical protein
MNIPRSIASFEMYTFVASGTISYRHSLSPISIMIVFSSSQSSSSWMSILIIGYHHLGRIIHAAVTKFGVEWITRYQGVKLMHVFIVNHGIAIYALPVYLFLSYHRKTEYSLLYENIARVTLHQCRRLCMGHKGVI